MKDVALIGANGRVLSSVLTQLLENVGNVKLYTLFPEKVMLENPKLTVSRFDVTSKDATREALEGFATVVIANETNLENAELDDVILKYFDSTVEAAAEAGAKRVIVVGAKDSTAFYVGKLERKSGIDWVFIDTEGDFASKVAQEVVAPKYHCENASF